jgi:hypothetical protein
MERSKKTKLILLSSLLLCFCPLFASELNPFYVRWQSANRLYYDHEQSGKELSWDEKYRAEFGYQNLQYKELSSSLKLQTEQFFDSNIVRLDELDISYLKDDFRIFAGTRRQGYGSNFLMDSYPTLKHGLKKLNFQEMRMNGLGLAYQHNEASYSLEIGGNIHNQALLLMNSRQDILGNKVDFGLDIRSMDSHWRTPVGIGSIKMLGDWPEDRASFKNEFALAIVPAFGDTPANQEYYAQSEASFRITRGNYAHIGASYIAQEYAPKISSILYVSYSSQFSNWVIHPQFEHSISDEDRLLQARLNLDFLINPESHIGLYYEFSTLNEGSARHTIGFALDLCHIFGSPFFVLPTKH